MPLIIQSILVLKKKLWAPLPIPYEHWQKRLAETKPFLYIFDDTLIGFIELLPTGYIDCFYVKPEYQGNSVGKNLLIYVIKMAESNGIKTLTVNASIIVKPLFEKFNFVLKSKNEHRRGNEILINYTMSLSLI